MLLFTLKSLGNCLPSITRGQAKCDYSLPLMILSSICNCLTNALKGLPNVVSLKVMDLKMLQMEHTTCHLMLQRKPCGYNVCVCAPINSGHL